MNGVVVVNGIINLTSALFILFVLLWLCIIIRVQYQ